MFIKLAKFKLKIKPKKAIKSLATFLLITSWLLTGWPGMQLGSNLFFPPKIQEVRADTIVTSTPGTVASVADAGTGCTNATATDWGTMTNTEVSDNAYAVYGTGNFFDASEVSEELQLSNFGITIPNGSTINGITVDIERKGTSGDIQDRNINLTKTAGVQIGTNKAVAADWGTTDATATYGSGSDAWGTTWSEAEIEASGFGLVICVQTLAGDANAIASIDLISLTVTYTPPPTTTLSTGSDPAVATVAPGSGIRSAGQFIFTTDTGSDTITALTLTLAGSPAGSYAAIDSVSIRDTSCSGTLYFSAVTPSSDSVSFSGGTALPVTTGGNTYYICVTPKDHTLASGTYSVSPYVSGTWTSGNGNTKAGTDDNANALTIDNTAPSGATNVSGSAGNTYVTLNWTTSSSGDFDTSNGSIVLRWVGGSAGSEVPAEGNSSYAAGNTITTATVACAISSAGSSAQSKIDGTGGSTGCTTTALNNGQAYTYKVFQRDQYGNYDAGVSIGTFTPTAASATFTQNKYRWYYDNNDLVNPTVVWGNPALAENTSIGIIPAGKDPPDTTQKLRLRVNMVVNTANLSALANYFKLEYKAGTDGSCTSGSWTDVGTGVWTYASSTVVDGSDITGSLSDTTALKGEQYAKSKPTALNNTGANMGEIIEYDFHIVGGTATSNTTYSFRVVGTDSAGSTETVLDAYTNCPTLITEPGTADLMRHGQVFTNFVKQGFFWAN